MHKAFDTTFAGQRKTKYRNYHPTEGVYYKICALLTSWYVCGINQMDSFILEKLLCSHEGNFELIIFENNYIFVLKGLVNRKSNCSTVAISFQVR